MTEEAIAAELFGILTCFFPGWMRGREGVNFIADHGTAVTRAKRDTLGAMRQNLTGEFLYLPSLYNTGIFLQE